MIRESVDASHFTPVVSPTTKNLYAIAFGKTRFVAGGEGGEIIMTGDDGTWKTGPKPFAGNADIMALAYIDTIGTFLATNRNGEIAASVDLETWAKIPSVSSVAIPANHAGFLNVDRVKNDQPGDLEMIVASACQTAGLNAEDLKMVGFREQVVNELESNYAWRGAWLHDIMAHCVEAMEAGRFGNTPQRHYRRGRPTARYGGESLCHAAIEAQSMFDARYGSAFDIGFNEIRADADTGFSTQGLRQIWTLITRATVATTNRFHFSFR